jgi:hypothetical protein
MILFSYIIDNTMNKTYEQIPIDGRARSPLKLRQELAHRVSVASRRAPQGCRSGIPIGAPIGRCDRRGWEGEGEGEEVERRGRGRGRGGRRRTEGGLICMGRGGRSGKAWCERREDREE